MAKKKKPTQPICPYCGEKARHVDNARIYGRSYGKSWICANYPECDSYVGAHRRTGEPFGSMANCELRLARNEVHAIFDRMWKSGFYTRNEAYAWLADRLEINTSACHVGMFDLPACKKAIEILQAAQ